ncbi:hypothetical protein, partial [Amycolatopsis sp. CA-126428]|uniref:hypothetical protein n=1 Tax=Amycolatopsis sp. CA-126428 TaxID=2073158 RepID=UPI0018EBBAA8
MGDNEAGLGRAVMYTLSGGFVSVAFGILGAAAAEAKPLPNDGGDPGSAMKTAGAVPGMGVFKVADAASKLAKNAGAQPKSGPAPSKDKAEKGGGEQKKEAPSEGRNTEKPDRTSKEDKPSPDRKRESPEKALKVAGLLPGMGAV